MLAQRNPKTYLPDIAMMLNNLGMLHRRQKRMEEAQKEYKEMLEINRMLTQNNPETYPRHPAKTLNHLKRRDNTPDRMEEAC